MGEVLEEEGEVLEEEVVEVVVKEDLGGLEEGRFWRRKL